MTQKNGEPNKVDYTRGGFETFIFLNPVLAGHPEDIVYYYVNSDLDSRTHSSFFDLWANN